MISNKGQARLLRNFLRNARALPDVTGTQLVANDLFSEINPVYLKRPGLIPGLMGMGHTGFFMGFIFTVYLLPLTIALTWNAWVASELFFAICLTAMALPLAGFFSYWWIKGLIFGRAPAPTYFNRKTGLVYFSFYGEPRAVPFDELTPMVNTGRVVGPGLASFRNLSLVQFKPGAEKTEENALCNIGISAMQNTSEVCKAQWEFIRKYMNGASPEQLPEIKLLQDKPDWVMWMVDMVDGLTMLLGVVWWIGHVNEFLLLYVYPKQKLPAEVVTACVYDPKRHGENLFRRQALQADPVRKAHAVFKAIVVLTYTMAGVWLYIWLAPQLFRTVVGLATGKF